MSLAIRFHSLGGPEVISVDEVDVRAPRAGEVRIRTRALGLNRADVMFRTGNHFSQPTFPQAFGLEAAGVVEALGPGVTGLTVGDAVSVVPATPLTEYPLFGDLVLAPARAVVQHPATLSFEVAASLWMAYTTAYGGLVDVAGLAAGDTVAISAASSSVGLAAIEIANAVGATPIAITRTHAKRQQLLDAGAHAVLATDTGDVTDSLNDVTNGAGAQVIFDPVAGPPLAGLMNAAATGAIVVVYGALDAEPTPLPILPLLQRRLRIRGYDMAEVTTDDTRLDEAVTFIRAGLESRALNPTIDAVYDLADIADAYRHLESGGQFGKVVIRMPS
ncbi:zinc-dependent alcohol dehydrogenase family protein [Mycobacterium sp. AT1]|uniref:zinc-dependent alcohol dehydrogenase family protein n=1 Tax=Mycobacterium sp. AT1 TaxID=1961706 RepID=UPI0009AD868E|nr:zinc-dependent alcohol dehydrogenase family protein [Mycobacterium sp. AT1]OPX11777.1 hypothetical protein B1790_06305 [Mycobacterium sp. AT1]